MQTARKRIPTPAQRTFATTQATAATATAAATATPAFARQTTSGAPAPMTDATGAVLEIRLEPTARTHYTCAFSVGERSHTNAMRLRMQHTRAHTRISVHIPIAYRCTGNSHARVRGHLTRTHTRPHAHIHTHIHIHIHMHRHIHMHMHTNAWAYAHASAHEYTHAFTRAYTSSCADACVHISPTYI